MATPSTAAQPPNINPTSDPSAHNADLHPNVRFASHAREISPEPSVSSLPAVEGVSSAQLRELPPDAAEEIRNLSLQLKGTQLHDRAERKLKDCAFVPVSLPASRVPSNTSSSQRSSRAPSRPSSRAGNMKAPSLNMHTPPLTPAGTIPRSTGQEGSSSSLLQQSKGRPDPLMMTPQASGPDRPYAEGQESEAGQASAVSPQDGYQVSLHPPDTPGSAATSARPSERFSIGPTSTLASETSPDLLAAGDNSRPSTPAHRPSVISFAPAGDANDPYARSKRAPQSKNAHSIDPRFIFSGKTDRRSASHSRPSTGNEVPSIPRNASSEGLHKPKEEKRHSYIFGHHSHSHKKDSATNVPKPEPPPRTGSMTNLARFFRPGGKKRSHSPADNHRGARSAPTTRTSTQVSTAGMPFAEDHGIESRYGKFGKVLGSGAGGSVRLLKRSSDGTVFAVKQFRDRHVYEGEREYNKKVTAEFCIGSTLHDGNIIETLDIIQEKGRWYEVMEYAPYDLFATVMTGKMSREEVACSAMQILSGVTYLHTMGLAHRDLKLDNVVMNAEGILKIIDFGSAIVYKYPFETEIVLAHGIVGSDPYLAPEVITDLKYDPVPTDIWSLAIIFCCMSLRRFPWKIPKQSDNSYRLFSADPDPEMEDPMRRLSMPPSSASLPNENETHHHHHRHHHRPDMPREERHDSTSTVSETANGDASQASKAIKGPWRLLRLLPRESRHIVGRMLTLNPKHRATIEEIWDDPWVQQVDRCRQDVDGTVIKAVSHTHVLEASAAQSAAETRTNKSKQ